MDRRFTPTREAGLSRLVAFAPRMGRAYAGERNADRGPEAEPTTSALSPYLRRRLVTEREAVAASLAEHCAMEAERFIAEVLWRTYFKGHLETRPAIWVDYRARVDQGRARLDAESGLRKSYESAISGRSGVEGFDDWALELTETGWLHNHARMWFASIWIFTLRLPWALGADFFMRHLLDGDPASNTLSWRWVGGLHTRGKHYVARADNIDRYTEGRFHPAGLDADPLPLDEPDPGPAIPLSRAHAAPSGEIALLLHLDDLHPESLDLGGARVRRVGGLVAHADGAVDRVRKADEDAMADALARAEAHFGCEAGLVDAGLIDDGWAGGLPVVAPWAPVGPSVEALPPCLRVRREWDDLVWPRSDRGFFRVKSAIPRILDEAGLM